MRTLPWLGAALALSGAFLPGREAVADPRFPSPQALKETAAKMVAARRTRLEKPSVVRDGRKITYSLGKVPLPTELTGSQPLAVFLQAQMEVEWLRVYAQEDAFVELWWRGTLEEADAFIAEGLTTLASTRFRRGQAHAFAVQARERLRSEVLLRPLQRLREKLDHEHPETAPHELEPKPGSAYVTFPSVRLVVTPASAAVRYCSEWDWAYWTLLGVEPRTKMESVSTAEPVRLDGSYYFELTPPGGAAPIVIGPRGVDPASGTVTLP